MLRPLLCLVYLCVVWGSSYLAVRIASTELPPLGMLGLRFVVAGVLLYALLRVLGQRHPTGTEWLGGALVGLLLIGGAGGTTAVALKCGVPSGVAALLFGAVPMATALIERALGLRLGRREVLGLLVGFAGIVLVGTRVGLGAGGAAVALVLAGACSAGAGGVLARRLPVPPGPMAAAVEMLAGGLAQLVASGLRGEVLVRPSPTALVAFAYLVVFASMLAYSALACVLRELRPGLAQSYAYVNPAVALVLGAALGGERIGPVEVTAMFLVTGGVGLLAAGSLGQPRRA